MRKRRIKKKPIIFLLIVIILINYYFIGKTKNKEIVTSNYKAIITEKEESNPEVVNEYFANGMNSDDYISTIEKVDNYLDIKGNYKKINYEIETKYHYNKLEEIYKQLGLSEIVKIEIIGKSVDGRNIYAIEIGNGDNVTIFEAGIHAAEFASPLFITKFMVDIVNRYENGDKEIANLLENNKIVVVPSVNPDGYEAALFGTEILNNQDLYIAKNADSESLKYIKSNANGIDLNRNFPSQTAGLYYKKYDLHYSVSLKKSTDMYRYFPGDTLGSEPETRAIIYLQNKWKEKLKSYVALHSAGRVIYNGKPYLSSEYNNNSNNCAQIVGDITDYMVMNKYDEEAGEGNDGTSTEYMAETLSGFIFSSKTGRLSSSSYMNYEKELKYKNTCVIVIEALENYTSNLKTIKDEYYNHKLEEAYLAIINRHGFN